MDTFRQAVVESEEARGTLGASLPVMEYFVFSGTEDLVYRYSVDLDALLELWDGSSWTPAKDEDYGYLTSGTLRPIEAEVALGLVHGSRAA